MAAIILLKRTRGTSPPNVAPVGTGVSFGELIYTYDGPLIYLNYHIPHSSALRGPRNHHLWD